MRGISNICPFGRMVQPQHEPEPEAFSDAYRAVLLLHPPTTVARTRGRQGRLALLSLCRFPPLLGALQSSFLSLFHLPRWVAYCSRKTGWTRYSVPPSIWPSNSLRRRSHLRSKTSRDSRVRVASSAMFAVACRFGPCFQNKADVPADLLVVHNRDVHLVIPLANVHRKPRSGRWAVGFAGRNRNIHLTTSREVRHNKGEDFPADSCRTG